MESTTSTNNGSATAPHANLVSMASVVVLLGGFALLTLLPPLLQIGYELREGKELSVLGMFKKASGEQKPIAQRLRDFETALEEASITDVAYRQIYTTLTYSLLGQGNHDVIRGQDEMLHYWYDIASIIGRDPTIPAPKSVAKEAPKGGWVSAEEAILDFANQLHERGIQLLVVPVPVKATIYPESLGIPATRPLVNPAQEKVYTKLRSAGVEVLDLTPAFMESHLEVPLFLNHDTHWSPAGVARAAKVIADAVKTYAEFEAIPGASKSLDYELKPNPVSTMGDLTRMLDFPEDSPFAVDERGAVPEQVIDKTTSQPVKPDEEAPIVLLGDSLANIYSTPGPSFEWGEGAGLPEHLMANLGLRVEVVAMNGGGASQARTEFLRRHKSLEGKRLVIWVMASRLLMLDEDRMSGMPDTWRKIKLPPVGIGAETAPTAEPTVSGSAASGEGLPEGALARVRAKVVAVPEVPNPAASPYPDMIMEVNYQVEEVLVGEMEKGPIIAMHWGFRDRKLVEGLPAVGDVLELTLAGDPPPEFASVRRGIAVKDMTEEGDFIPTYWPLESSKAGQ